MQPIRSLFAAIALLATPGLASADTAKWSKPDAKPATVIEMGPSAHSPSYRAPWKDEDAVFVLDAYEFNEIDWPELLKDKRIKGFINKASDGMPEVYDCRNGGLNNSTPAHCKTRWRKYSVTKELYRTRRALAKAHGLKWGAYHMGRPGNPEAQADHFLDFAEPAADEFIAIDLEDNDPGKWMSIEEVERFARRVHQRIGRWPALYTNGSTAKFIAANKDKYPIASRLPLWYARFKGDITGAFPMGNWDSYHSWQFLAQINCRRRCAMRPAGTNKDIDVNVVNTDMAGLDAMWATKDLLPVRGATNEPMLVARNSATSGPVIDEASTLTAYAPIAASAASTSSVFEKVLGNSSLKAKLSEGTPAPDVPTPLMRPQS